MLLKIFLLLIPVIIVISDRIKEGWNSTKKIIINLIIILFVISSGIGSFFLMKSETNSHNEESSLLHSKLDTIRSGYDSLLVLFKPIIDKLDLYYPDEKYELSLDKLLNDIDQIKGKTNKLESDFLESKKNIGEPLLIYKSQTYNRTDSGHEMKIHFFPSNTNSLGEIEMSAEIISDDNARIILFDSNISGVMFNHFTWNSKDKRKWYFKLTTTNKQDVTLTLRVDKKTTVNIEGNKIDKIIVDFNKF